MTQSKFKFGYRVLYYITLFGLFFEFFAYPVYAMATHFPYGMSSAYYIPFIRSDFKSLHNPDSLVFEELENTDAGKNKIQTKDRQEQIYVSHKAAVSKSNREELLEFFSEDSSGIIGYNNSGNSDDPSDNIFKLHIDKAQLSGKELQLRYEVYGIENTSGVARSINAHNATGGYFVQKNTDWKSVEETISINQLKQGENYVLFTAFENQKIDYKIKNVRITALPQENIQWISLADQGVLYVKDDKAYVKGNVSHSSAKLYINNQYVPVRNHEFETVLDNAADLNNLNLKLVKADGTILYQEDVLIQSVKEVLNFVSYKSPEILIPVRQAEDKTYGFALSDVDLAVTKEHYEKADQITVQKLRNIDLAPLGTNIINVTNQRVGYRFLPDGAQFKEPAKLTLTYDAKLLPKGYDERDVKVLYFDMQQRRWLAVQTDTIIKEEQKIVALTDHFTDYIAGVIQAPESPETNSFTPTSISDIQVANPTANIMQIQPPTANQKGDGTLDFPITVPAGRGGLQPNLSVSYNNNGSSGIVGYGWDIAIPYISVDTKFGVPAYDSSRETESYLLNGEELLLKNGNDLYLPHRSSTTINRVSNATFYPKVEGSFSKIERIGTSPTNYYWLVWDKSGTKYYYGQSANSRLGSGSNSGNIGKWMLEKVEDKNGNYIEYHYFTQTYSSGNLSEAKEILLASIAYTKHPSINYYNSQNGRHREFYVVNFIYENSSSRTDKNFNFRYGFKEANAAKLNKIEVFSTVDLKLRGQFEINYLFDYSVGQFGKQLLSSIETVHIKRKEDSQFIEETESYKHQFDYHNDVQGGLFGPEQTIGTKDDSDKKLSVLEGTVEKDIVSGSFNGGGGVFFPGFLPSYLPISYAGTVNINFDIPYSFTSKPTISLIDIDGDGLPDKVIKIGNTFKYRKNMGSSQFSAVLYDINHFNELSSSRTRVSSNPSMSFSLLVGSKSFSNNKSISESNIFLTDVNADGLVDYVKDKIVYFNRIDPNSGIPSFTEDSSLTPNLIFKEGDVDPDVLAPLPNLNLDNDLMDVVKVWVAPKSGTINITGTISKQFVASDNGVRYAVEKNYFGRIVRSTNSSSSGNIQEQDSIQNEFPSESMEADESLDDIETDDDMMNSLNNSIPVLDLYDSTYLIEPSLLVLNSANTNIAEVAVNKGDHIYFRVNSSQVPGTAAKVSWDPQITYTTENFDSPNQYKQYSSKYSESYIYGNTFADPLVISKPGTYLLQWDSFTINNTLTTAELSDDVIIKAVLFKANQDQNNNAPEIPINTFIYTIKRNVNNTLNNPNILLSVPGINEQNIETYYYLRMEVLTDSQINWKKLDDKFKPRVVYANTNETYYLKPSYRVFPHQVTKYYKSTFSSATTLSVKHNFSLSNCTQSACQDQLIYLIVKNQYGKIPNTTNGQPAKFRYKVNSYGSVTEVRQFNGTAYSGIVSTTTLSQIVTTAGSSLYFEYYAETLSIASKLNTYQDNYNNLVTSNIGSAAQSTGSNTGLYKANIFYAHNLTGFGTLYRNWGQFAYKGAKPHENFQKIKRSYLGIHRLSGLSSEEPNEQEAQEQQSFFTNTDPNNINYDPNTGTVTGANGTTPNSSQIAAMQHFTSLQPNRGAGMWSSHPNLFVKAQEMSPFLRYDLGAATLQSFNIPAPQLNTIYGAVSIVRQSSSRSEGSTQSLSFGFLGLGNSTSEAESTVLNDYQDVNGDGYPDIIGDKVQLTSYRGGLSNRVLNNRLLYRNLSNGTGKIVSGSPVTITQLALNGKTDIRIGNHTSGTAGLGSNGFTTHTEALGKLLDINGDGLADQVFENGVVHFNNSNGFNQSSYTGYSKVSFSRTKLGGLNASLGGGYTDYYGNYDPNTSSNSGDNFMGSTNLNFSVGISGSRSATVVLNDFMDINGDGLVDYISNGSVLFNTGTGFTSSALSLARSPESNVSQIGGAINLSVLVMIPFAFIPIGIKFGGGGGATISTNYSDETTRYLDFDGDGYPDMVHSNNEESVKVRFSKIGRTNMLKMVYNPTGSKIELDYATYNTVSGTAFGPTYKMPFKKWVLSNVKVHDGFTGDGEDVQYYAFEYKNGLKDRRERKFLGFGEVKTYQLKSDGAIYRSTVQQYMLNDMLQQEIYLPGNHSDSRKYQYIGNLLKKESTYDGMQRLLSTNEYDYTFFKLAGAVVPSQGFSTNSQATITYTDMSRILPLVKRNTSKIRHYQGNSQTQYVETENKSLFSTYDKYGNVTAYKDEIDNNQVTIKYHVLDNINKYLVNVPSTHSVNTNQRYSVTEIDNLGNITEIRRYKDYGTSNDIAITNFEYDILGNLTKVTLPKPNMSSTESERMFYDYFYKEPFDQFVTNVMDAHGYTSETTYMNFGMPVKQKDLNGIVFSYEYDAVCRLKQFTGPYNSEWTIRNEYNRANGLYYAVTKHNIADETMISGEQILYTSSFADGLGRIIQTKKQLATEQECSAGTGYRFSVSGRQIYDEFGRVTESYIGQEEKDCNGILEDQLIVYTNLQHVAEEKTDIAYDMQDRVLQQHVYGLNATTQYAYGYGADGFGQSRGYEKIVLPEGNTTVSYKDHKGRVTTTKQIGDNMELLTKFKYNDISELLEVTDAENKATRYSYDKFGQKIKTEHPDSGTNLFVYDLTGKLTSNKTQNLINSTQQIEYNYEFNQLNTIIYPSHSVKYVYGLPNASDNGSGRITEIHDLTGSKKMKYGRLGEVTEEERVLYSQNSGELYFKHQYRYDSWGRLMEMTYPDGERLQYTYNSVGQLKSIANTNGEYYLKDVYYTFFDQPERIIYGNEVVTTNEYDITQRIRAMQLDRPDASTFMRNIYSYDRNQNITKITNNSSQHQILKLGGVSYKDYFYDGFNRLKKAKGLWQGYEEDHYYDLEMHYNATHGIKDKYQEHGMQDSSFSGFSDNTYRANYKYENPEHPHAVSSIDYTNVRGSSGNNFVAKFEYDANGNMIDYQTDLKSFNDRKMIWDEQNRLLAVIDDATSINHYVYDHAGERTLKSEGSITQVNIGGQQIYKVEDFDNYLVYPSGYIVAHPSKDQYSKHYYINGKRFASRLDKDISRFKLPVNYAATAENGVENTPLAQYATYGITIGNTETDCLNQLNAIRQTYILNNAPPAASLQHCINYIDQQINNQNLSKCDALILVNQYLCEPKDVNAPGNVPGDTSLPVLTPIEMQQLDCLTELNILAAEYSTAVAVQSGYQGYTTTYGARDYGCESKLMEDCCIRYQHTGVWDCPNCPELTVEDCGLPNLKTITPEWENCIEKCISKDNEGSECWKRYINTGKWDEKCFKRLLECDCNEFLDLPDNPGNPDNPEDPQIPGVQPIDSTLYNCAKLCRNHQTKAIECYQYFYENGKWQEGCEQIMSECGCINIKDPLDCYRQALNYIVTELRLIPYNNACEVLEYVVKHYNCLPTKTPPEIPEIPDDLPDDWTDNGGNDDIPIEDPVDESLRKPIWWYHTDHLGSSTYLTDNFGRPSHYYETLPFGEMMVEHNQSANNPTNGGYNNAYKFNGKELDDATGMYYYGARYYDPRISIFVSVDPLAEQFAGWTPYHYVHQNPINLIDPTGMYGESWQGGGYGNKERDSWVSRAWTEVKSWFGGKSNSSVTVGPLEENNYSSFSKEKFSNDWKDIKEKSGYNFAKKYYDTHDFGLPGVAFAKEGGSNLDAEKGKRGVPWIDMDWLFALMEVYKIGPETKVPGVADVHTPSTFDNQNNTNIQETKPMTAQPVELINFTKKWYMNNGGHFRKSKEATIRVSKDTMIDPAMRDYFEKLNKEDSIKNTR